MGIIFYDFPSKVVNDNTWNPNTWKIRYALNYKKIPYTRELVEYAHIEKVCKEKGIPPTNTDETALYHYTLPSIYDTSTGTGVSDSFRIAKYLDQAYPDTPNVIPPGTEALQIAWLQSMSPYLSAMWQFAVPGTLELIDHPESHEYFYTSRNKMFGKDLKSLRPKGEAWEGAMKNLEEGFEGLDKSMLKSGSPFFLGETVSFVDFAVAGLVKWLQITVGGKDSKEWQRIATWSEGRWVQRLEALEKYENPQV
ncbi:hypothetical protein AX15_001496 [Amanita polypyramis BW_CC]|nr:hypothetical protein AX15_001496 [Amanita polypyramis BW_CC]